jgi:hypothetical protein
MGWSVQSVDPCAPFYLQCSVDYLAADDLERFKVCNGCGSAKAKFDFIPDGVYGLSIREACYIHDWDYHFGRTDEDRRAADKRFLDNMLTLIELRSSGLFRSLRRWRAMTYYNAVREKGEAAFWFGKARST